MKKFIALVLSVALVASALIAAPVSYKNNTYQKLAEEYTVKAQKALDAGEYALAEEYARLAQENAALSEEFIRLMMARNSAEEVIASTDSYIAQIWRDAEDSGALPLPEEYDQAKAYLQAAKDAYEAGDFETAADLAAKAMTSAAACESYIAKHGERSACDEVMKAAEDRIAYVESIRGDVNYPLAYEAAVSYYKQACDSYDSEDYDGAKALAQLVLDTLADVKEMTPLPKYYIVRPWAETKDCFWNISGRPYVYNNPFLWENLYEVNKGKLPQKNNPNLIQPGMVMEIPSLTGEYRDGTFSPDEEYTPYQGM